MYVSQNRLHQTYKQHNCLIRDFPPLPHLFFLYWKDCWERSSPAVQQVCRWFMGWRQRHEVSTQEKVKIRISYTMASSLETDQMLLWEVTVPPAPTAWTNCTMQRSKEHGLSTQTSWVQSWHHDLLASLSWASYFISLCIGFLFGKIIPKSYYFLLW